MSREPEPAPPQPATIESLRSPGWSTAMLEVDGLQLRIAERGVEGTPLLLINGIGAHVDMWEPLVARLGDRHLIAFDLPGCGESPRASWPRRMPSLAKLSDRLLAELGHEEADVLGYSFGGAVAQEVARRYPSRVRRLVLCGTSAGVISVPPKPLPALFLISPARYYHPVFFRFMMPRIVGGQTARDPAALDAQIDARLARPPDLVGYVHQLYAASGWTSAHYLHQLSQPALVLAGDDDRAIPLSNARFLAWRIPNAQLHVIERGGHAFLLDQPEAAVGVIEEFLDAP